MASKRARDRARTTSLEGLRDAATPQILLLCLDNYFGNDVCSLGKNTPGINSLPARYHESNVSLCGLFACFGCCLANSQSAVCCRSTEWLMSLATTQGVRMPGVEPGSQAWEACMIPLHYMRFCSSSGCAIRIVTAERSRFEFEPPRRLWCCFEGSKAGWPHGLACHMA